MRNLALTLAAIAASAALAGPTVQLGSLKDTNRVVRVEADQEVSVTGNSISLRNTGAETGLDIVGSGQGVVVTNGTTVYVFPERSGTVMLGGDETDPTVPNWAKATNPPAETDPTVPNWAKATNPPAETDPTVPDWAKSPDPPVSMDYPAMTNTVNAVKALRWDEGLEVTWTNVVHNGHVYMVTVTNENVSVLR